MSLVSITRLSVVSEGGQVCERLPAVSEYCKIVRYVRRISAVSEGCMVYQKVVMCVRSTTVDRDPHEMNLSEILVVKLYWPS